MVVEEVKHPEYEANMAERCTWCEAKVGERCKNRRGVKLPHASFHAARYKAAANTARLRSLQQPEKVYPVAVAEEESSGERTE